MNLKNITNWDHSPSFSTLFWRSLILSRKPDPPDQDSGIYPFKDLLKPTDIYAEYGCGDSTIWVSTNTLCPILSVDSSLEWIKKVKIRCPSSKSILLHHADLGQVGDWGRPLSYEKCDQFTDYTDWIWMQKQSPSFVLLDGRFRVCCFLTCLLFAREGTKILFDDYLDRKYYHFVERLLKPSETRGTQALFIVPHPEKLDFKAIKNGIDSFRFVFD